MRCYTIEPKVQEEEFQGSEDEDEDLWDDDDYSSARYQQPSVPEVTRCIICGSQDREDVLMLCDYCDDCYHAFCVGMDVVPSGKFNCPNCIAQGRCTSDVNLSDGAAIRTVAGMRYHLRNLSTRRLRRRGIPMQRLQLETWTAAWSRVRERAWARLNEELELEPIADDCLTAGQEDEVRAWRVRMARRAPISSRTATVEDSKEQDPVTANLWKAFEQASKFSDVGSHADGSRPRSSRRSSPQSPIHVIETPGPSGHKQKRPNASHSKPSNNARKRSNPAEFDASPASSKRIAGPRHDLPEGSFLTSLLSNIKHQPRHADQPIRLVIDPAQSIDRPLSPLSNGPSTSASVTNSPTSPSTTLPNTSYVRTHATREKQESKAQSRTSRPLSPPVDIGITKADIAKIVSARLKPFYHSNQITKDEFIKINRDVTRRVFGDYAHRTDVDDIHTKLNERVAAELTEEYNL